MSLKSDQLEIDFSIYTQYKFHEIASISCAVSRYGNVLPNRLYTG